MAKLNSTAVKVFPSAFRGPNDGTAYNPESRLNTEFNLTNLTNKVVSKDSFVVSWDSGSKTIIFNIHGYYFECDLTNNLSGSEIYASIKILPFTTDEAGNTTYKAFTLVGTEDGGSVTIGPTLDYRAVETDPYSFMGLDLHSTSITPATGVYELHLLTGGPSSWAIPTASKLKLKSIEIEDTTTSKNISEEFHTGKINNVVITAPAVTPATLTLAAGKVLTVNNTLTLTGTDASSVALGTGGTVAYIANKLNTFASTSSSELADVISDETGTGKLVFATSPTFVTPTLGAATATSINDIEFSLTTSPYTYFTIKPVGISKAITALQSLTIGSVVTETGSVTIKSAGSSPTTIVGPNGGYVLLPSVSTAAGAMKMLIGTGDNSATWAVDMLKSSYGPTSYHGLLTVTTSLNGTIYRGTYSTSSLIFSRFFRPTTALTDLAKCAALTQLSFVVPYATAPNATFGTTTITLAYIPGQITSVQTDNYAAVSDTGGTQTGTGSKITISAVGVCTIDVATAKSGSGNFGESAGNLTLSGSIIQITE